MELATIQRMFETNNYPRGLILDAISRAKSAAECDRNDQPEEKGRTLRVSCPYVPGVTDALRRMFRTFGVQLACRPRNQIRSALPSLKTPVDPQHQSGVVYSIPCAQCPVTYKGETEKWLATRVDQHREYIKKRDPKSAIYSHVRQTGHRIGFDQARIITKESKPKRRKKLEALALITGDNPMPKNKGEQVEPCWRPLLPLVKSQLFGVG